MVEKVTAYRFAGTLYANEADALEAELRCDIREEFEKFLGYDDAITATEQMLEKWDTFAAFFHRMQMIKDAK